MTKNIQKKLKKSLIIFTFALILLASFILFNTSAGLLFSGRKLDLTADNLNSLNPKTENLIRNLKNNIVVKVYLSRKISKDNPLLAQYAQMVLRTLEQYKNKSNGRIKIEIIDPIPYTTAEQEAKSQGVKPLTLAGDENSYFGAVFSNEKGQNYTIPYFSQGRQNYLENDLTRAISRLSLFTPQTIGIASDLPIADTSFQGKKAQKDWTFVNLLKNDYTIQTVSTGTPEIPFNIDTLIIVDTGRLSSPFIYAVDQFIMRGGKLLVLIDPASENTNSADGTADPEGPNINTILNNVGIEYLEEKVIGDKKLTETTNIENADKSSSIQEYYPWFKLAKSNINQDNPLTSGLSTLSFRSPGGFELRNGEDFLVFGLFETSDNILTIDAQIAKYTSKSEVMRYLSPIEGKMSLGALSEGNYNTIFKKSPFEGTSFANQITPFLVTSLQPTQIIAIADTDFVSSRTWAKAENKDGNNPSEIVPTNNNFDFIQRAVDYLSGNSEVPSIANKDISDRSLTVYKKIHDAVFKKYEIRYNEVKRNLDNNQRKLDTINIMIKNRDMYTSAKTLGDLDALQRSIAEDQEELRHLDYIIKTETQTQIDTIVLYNTLIFPFAILMFIILLNIYLSRRGKKRAGRLIYD